MFSLCLSSLSSSPRSSLKLCECLHSLCEKMQSVKILLCRRSRVVSFTAIRLRGPGFKPRPGQKFENENFCFRRTPAQGRPSHGGNEAEIFIISISGGRIYFSI